MVIFDCVTVNSEQDVEEDEEEQLFELVPVLNGEVSPVINEVEDGEEEEKEKEPSEESDSEQKEDDSMPGCQSETTISPQRAIIEDIRFEQFSYFFLLSDLASFPMDQNVYFY